MLSFQISKNVFSVVALQDAGLDTVDHLFVANMGGGRINHQTALSSAVLDHLSLWPAGS